MPEKSKTMYKQWEKVFKFISEETNKRIIKAESEKENSIKLHLVIDVKNINPKDKHLDTVLTIQTLPEYVADNITKA